MYVWVLQRDKHYPSDRFQWSDQLCRGLKSSGELNTRQVMFNARSRGGRCTSLRLLVTSVHTTLGPVFYVTSAWYESHLGPIIKVTWASIITASSASACYIHTY